MCNFLQKFQGNFMNICKKLANEARIDANIRNYENIDMVITIFASICKFVIK
jgi:hypothetical protein